MVILFRVPASRYEVIRMSFQSLIFPQFVTSDQPFDVSCLVCCQAEPDKLLGSGSTVHTVELLLPIDGGAQVQCRLPLPPLDFVHLWKCCSVCEGVVGFLHSLTNPVFCIQFAFAAAGCDAKIVGKTVYKGEVHARAYGTVREPISRAIDGLKVWQSTILTVRCGIRLHVPRIMTPLWLECIFVGGTEGWGLEDCSFGSCLGLL